MQGRAVGRERSMEPVSGERSSSRRNEGHPRQFYVPLLLIAAIGGAVTFVGLKWRVRANKASLVGDANPREADPPYARRTEFPQMSPQAGGVPAAPSPPRLGPGPTIDPKQRLQDLRRASEPREAIAKVMRELQRSGPSDGTLESKAFDVLQSWQHSTPLGSNVTMYDFKCFAGGCSVAVTADNMAKWHDAANAFTASEQFLSWTGPKFVSGPVVSQSGDPSRIDGTWVLYR